MVMFPSYAKPATALSDASDVCANATEAPRDTWINQTIESASDVDWYKVTVVSSGWMRALLGSLPADYNLELYSSCDARVDINYRPQNWFEEIYKDVLAGTYRIRVASAPPYLGGDEPAFDPVKSYALKVSLLAPSLLVIGSNSWVSNGRIHMAGEVLNNTSSRYEQIVVDVRVRNSSGTEVARKQIALGMKVLRGRMRSSFEASMLLPSGAASDQTTFSVSGTKTSADSIKGLRFTVGWGVSDGDMLVHGAVQNRNDFSLSRVNVFAALYDNRGYVLGARRVGVASTPLVYDEYGNFRARFEDHYERTNYVGYTAEAFR